MKTISLLLFNIFLSLSFYGQTTKVVTYPLNLIYSKHLEACLKPYDVALKDIENSRNTFISTLDFIKRFESHCDPIIFEFYDRNDKQLWEIDLQVAKFYDSLSIADLSPKEEGSLKEDYYKRLSVEFRNFSNLKKGNLKVIDYKNVDNKSKNLVTDLKNVGLNKKEINNYLLLIK